MFGRILFGMHAFIKQIFICILGAEQNIDVLAEGVS
jgi:hypothetical protein